MDHLPEDVLLTVMQYLSVPDLLACRLVCKRIGGLALHPHVWRRRHVSDRDRYCVPVLRLAPCLASLTVALPADDQQLYSITRCAVSSLSLTVNEGGSAVFAALVIGNQEMLGRLKYLDVRYWAEETGADASALLWPVAFTSGLVALAVSVYDRREYVISTNSLPTARPRSSLRTFKFNLRPDLGPFCDFVLASHADTLEEVDLEGNCNFSTSALTSTASLLAGMPNLRRLYNCPLLPGLDAVAACESLELVSLGVGCRMRDCVPQTKEFLRRAKQLRNVTLEYRDEASTNGVGVDLVLALVSSGPSLVESLTIDINEYAFSTFDPQPQLQPVIRALPLMPALQELELDTASEALLLAITPATNPALQTIKLHPTEFNTPRCAHEYLHWDSVETLLSRNPSLDLIVYTSHYCVEGHPNACEPCELGCHEEVWESDWREECEYRSELGDDEAYTDWITIPRLNLSPVLIDSIAMP